MQQASPTIPTSPANGVRRGTKNDHEARRLWGAAYDGIPKSVFAVMAYYLAGNSVDSAEDPAQVRARLLEEIDALSGQIIDKHQGDAALKAARKAFAGMVNS